MEYYKNGILKKQNIKKMEYQKNRISKKWNNVPQGTVQLCALENGILKKQNIKKME